MLKMAEKCIFFVIIVVLSISVFQVKGCQVDTVGGGCPDQPSCQATCGGCFRGIGRVIGSCEAPGAGTNWWICHCYFEDGAPCPPAGTPQCPSPPILASRSFIRHPLPSKV